jgi:hypothetical protein
VVLIPEDDYNDRNGIIQHYGTPRHSGRYPWGSGDNPQSQRNHTLLSTADELKAKGLEETDIAKALGLTTTQLRDIRTVARAERKQGEIHMAATLKEKGLSNVAIGKQMSQSLGYRVGESQVRELLKPSQERKAKVLDTVTDTLRKAVDEKGYLDVGSGVEYQLNITDTKLRSALQRLKDEGYAVHPVKVEQLGTGKFTNMRVLAKPGTTWGEAQKNRHNIKQLQEYSDDGGLTVLGILPPLSLSSKRVGIRYAEQGGADADGVIYVRPGVKDVELGGSRYAQVRIAVDGTHYLKGMAIYKDDLPAGVDVLFNTNKNDKGNKLAAMKPLKRLRAPGDDPSKPDEFTGPVDQDNPFGASIARQLGTRNPLTGKLEKLHSAMNIVNEEGRWDQWSKSLSTQMLSKQKPSLAREQLDLTYTKKKNELEAIMKLSNPSVRRKLLEAFADGTDASAVHLKAAHLPRQKTQVLLPVKEMKENEVYAPNFKSGEKVVLIRFPHGGTFEIPELTVNNKTPAARKLLGSDARDAIGIHPKVAERLSGADFDGDTVLVIPNNMGKVRTSSPLEGLKNFDPKSAYPPYEGMKRMTAHEKGMQMGLVSNLITDMTIGQASSQEIARAVRHSMVVIDAEKHNLDYRRSSEKNGIPALMKKYQKSSRGGASTLISKATSPKKVPERKERSAAKGGAIDRATGKKVYENTGKTRTWTDENGKTHVREISTIVDKLADTDDAHTLSSGTVIEKVYADHSNRLKTLANIARKELVSIKSRPYNSSAKIAFRSEVETLNAKLTQSLKNAPRERQAQVIANATVRLKIQANPDLKLKENRAELKRLKSQALSAARIRTDAAKATIDITDAEWRAIQAGAITAHKLDQILTYADLDKVKELATPRAKTVMSTSDTAKARSLHSRGYTWAEVADALGVSVSTVQETVGGDGD